MKKDLEELKESFHPYSLLWNEWCKYRLSGLTEEDIYIIQVHLNNNFQFIDYNLIMFYNRPDKIYQVVQKLNSNYSEFQEWVVSKFLVTLMDMAISNGLNSFFGKPVTFLDIPNDLKKCLMFFGFETLLEVIENYSDNDFKERTIFKNIVDFLSLKITAEKTAVNEFA